jgi:hypothetical protein
MDQEQQKIIERLSSVFMPYSQERRAFVKEKNLKFVHYTTAENALNIWRTKRIYMRNTICMNDYREFRHGLDYLFEIFREEAWRREFIEVVNLPDIAYLLDEDRRLPMYSSTNARLCFSVPGVGATSHTICNYKLSLI